MTILGAYDVVVLGAIALLVIAIPVVAHRRSAGAHRKPTPASPDRMAAEQERDLLKGGSLWADVSQPRYVPRRPHRRP